MMRTVSRGLQLVEGDAEGAVVEGLEGGDGFRPGMPSGRDGSFSPGKLAHSLKAAILQVEAN